MVCVVDVRHDEKIQAVEPTEYTATAGIVRAVEKIPTKIEPQIEEEEVSVVEAPEPQWVEMDVPSNNSFKSYMDCKYITDESSDQYKLKFEYLSSASGIMMVDDRYVVAVGSYYTTEIGCRIDLVMENGAIVNCIVGDCKADKHTDSSNRQNPNGSVVEFIVCTDNLSDEVRLRGDCSYADENLMGEISSIRVYLEN